VLGDLSPSLKYPACSTILYLKDLVGADIINDGNQLELFLIYYLCIIIYEHNYPTSFGYHIEQLDKIPLFDGKELSNPFPERKEIIQNDMKKEGPKIIESVETFKIDIDKLNQIIFNFQASLQHIIDNADFELKGTCIKEKEFGIGDKIKSIFHRA
jgi:hypothetical protein